MRSWRPSLMPSPPRPSAAPGSGGACRTSRARLTSGRMGSRATLQTLRPRPPRGPLSAQALASSQPGRRVRCGAANTGRQGRERYAPPTPAQPGRRARRAQEALRHGTRGLIHAGAVATGQRAWTMGATWKATDGVAPRNEASPRFPGLQREAGVRDPVHPPWRLDVCRVRARGCTGPWEPHRRKTRPPRRGLLHDPRHRPGWPVTPQPGSWLTHAACCLRVLPRRVLARGRFASAQDGVRPLERWWQEDHARPVHPYRGTSTGKPCGRDTPLSRTRRQQRWGRACCRPRPTRWARLCSAPRPSRRQAA